MGFPQRKAAIVGVYNTKQAKMLEGTPWTLALEAIQGALDDAISLLSSCPNIQLLLNAAQFSPSGRRFGSYYGYGR